ncbi:ELWxxDGT repeat protein [Luteolibacter marinus]|uniref:ELWxxDGT repeat protein n=1 Tax=Luteolibacter marinus TaxID=2776705 RepID=UPI0018685526|nr:ELWxxDGT repeat protein [Luteolibacter marinus]
MILRLFKRVEPGIANLLIHRMSPRSCVLMLLAFCSGCLVATAAVPHLVKDINPSTGTVGSDPTEIFVDGNDVYLSVKDPINGYHLKTSDGTAEGTSLFKTFPKYFVVKWAPREFARMGANIYFSSELEPGKTLWKCDGTEKGTVPLETGAASSASLLTPAGNLLFFVAGLQGNGSELWVSDGTDAGTHMVKDINPGPSSSRPHDLRVLGGMLYFFADDGVNGTELWSSDGTEAGTQMVKAVVPPVGVDDGYPNQLLVLGDQLVFRADDGIHGPQVWFSDGTEAGTRMIEVTGRKSSGLIDDDLAVMDDCVYYHSNDGIHGPELWKSDGTADGTMMVKDLSPDPSNPRCLGAVGSRLFFTVETSAYGREMWVTDGTDEGSLPLPEFRSGRDGIRITNREIEHVASGGLFYYVVTDGIGDSELWRSDGTGAGTFFLTTVQSRENRNTPALLRPFKGGIVFAANDGIHGTEVWLSDGSVAGTRMLADLDPSPGSALWSSLSSNSAAVGETIYFSASDAEHGLELWVSNGTEDGTRMVADIWEGQRGSDPSAITAVGDLVFFIANHPQYGRELWKSDGTAGGTELVIEMYPGTRSSQLTNLCAHDGRLYFLFSAFSLWCVDTRREGTLEATNITPDSVFAVSGPLIAWRDHIYFSASTPESGKELWRSDGTKEGTRLLVDIVPGALSSDPWSWGPAGEFFYFQAGNGVNGDELWRSDGSADGTSIVQDVAPGYASSIYPVLPRTAVGSKMYFVADDGVSGRQIWVTDSNGIGATRLTAFEHRAPFPSGPSLLGGHEGKLYFTEEDESGIYDLWSSDGTAGGTLKVRASVDGGPRTPRDITSAGDRAYFTAISPVERKQLLWRCDGTAESTVPIAGQFDTSTGFVINAMIATENRLFLDVETVESGRELWTLALEPGMSVEQATGDSLAPVGEEVVWDLSNPDDIERNFVVRNTGEYDLEDLKVELVPPDTGAYRLDLDSLAGSLLPDGSTAFAVSRTGMAGSGKVKLVVSSSTGEIAQVEVAFTEYLPLPDLSWDASELHLNRQTGLFELTLVLTNSHPVAVGGFEINVSNLPDGVTFYGADADGSLQYPGTIAAGSSVSMVLEFHATSRNPGTFEPSIVVRASAPELTDGTGDLSPIERIAFRDDGVFIDFHAIPSRSYRLEYSEDGRTWTRSSVAMVAGAEHVQVVDRGPPLTESPPDQAPCRFYRIREEGNR